MRNSNLLRRYLTGFNGITSYIRLSVIMTRFCWCLILVWVAGCDSSDSGDPAITIEVLPNSEPLISLGQDVQLDVMVTNSAGVEVMASSVTWTSSDAAILSVSSAGLMTGVSSGTATVTAEVDSSTGIRSFHVVDLTGTWIGGVDPDNVTYTLTQTGTSVDGVFQSSLGFPPITNVNTGALTGSLSFARYSHVLELTAEDGCVIQVTGDHLVEVEAGELILIPDPEARGSLSSTNCSTQGVIDFATLRRQ